MFDTVGEGNDTVTANGRTRHVHAYLRDFLFSRERANSPVKALSGGERNRLLLARLFTRPANVLVLDEPTNDLDLETLELLEDELVEWPGTLLLVSHDRAFLDNVVTSTFVFEGDGQVQEYVGGYEDWLRQRREDSRSARPQPDGSSGRDVRPASSRDGDVRLPLDKARGRQPDGNAAAATTTRKKLSYKEQREIDALPSRIEALEVEQRELQARIASPGFYKEPRTAIDAALGRAAGSSTKLPKPTRAGTNSTRAGEPALPPAGRMLTVAAELDGIAFVLAVLAAVLPPCPALGHGAVAGRMRAFL